MSNVVHIHAAPDTNEEEDGIEGKHIDREEVIQKQHDTRKPLAIKEECIIHCENVHKTYLLGLEGIPALRGVSIDIHKGEFICILGKSGGGKTSMLNILGTIDRPTKGRLTICGKEIRDSTTDEEFAELRLRKIGFVFQTFNLIASMTAMENVSLPMVLDGTRTKAEIEKRAKLLLTRVGMGERIDHLPSQLSGGEQQRVTIARSIANEPELLLLDEPTGDLDTTNSNIIMDMLLQLNRMEGITCIMVTHDRALKSFSHRTIHMIDGKINYIESIPASVREETDSALKAELAGEGELERNSTVHEMETEVRDVSFYAHGAARPVTPL